jgi:hypothetical protein
MSLLKGLLVVIAVYAIGMITKIFWLQSFASIVARTDSTALLFPVLMVIFGIVAWLIRGGISNLVATKAFKSKGSVKDLLYGYGMSHFPLVAVYISSLFMFSNIGLFIYLFFMVFAPLLMYTFFVNAVMMFHNLDWKKSLLTVFVTEMIIILPLLVIAGSTTFLGFYIGGNELASIIPAIS